MRADGGQYTLCITTSISTCKADRGQFAAVPDRQYRSPPSADFHLLLIRSSWPRSASLQQYQDRQYHPPSSVDSHLSLFFENECTRLGNTTKRKLISALLLLLYNSCNVCCALDDPALLLQELEELERATRGTLADKIQYFDARVQTRLEQLKTPSPTEGSAVSFEQRRKLSVSVSNLQMDLMYGLMEVIASAYTINIEGTDEVTLDIDQLPDAVLLKMQVRSPACLCSCMLIRSDHTSLCRCMLLYGSVDTQLPAACS